MPPVAHAMRSAEPERWVRFHSLPDAKRYPEDDEEWEEVLHRADAVISAACDSGEDLMVVTALYGSPGAEPARHEFQVEVQPDADYWREAFVDPDEADWPLHLWTCWMTYSSHSLDSLIRRTAEWQLTGVLIVAPGSSIAMHAYDGGIDVLLPTPQERDVWARRFSTWTSPHCSGL